MNNKPIVAVTGPNKGGLMAWIFTAAQVRLAGGKPIRIQPKNYQSIAVFDALVIGGGTDIHPESFHAKTFDQSYKKNFWSRIKEFFLYPYEGFSKIFKKEEYDIERDGMEKAYYLHAKFSKKPILGICRGHQLINAEEGAGLITDTDAIYKESPRVKSVFPRKNIEIYSDSQILKKFVSTKTAKVNAIHSQAIYNMGKDFRKVAVEENQLIQATENANRNILTVQWHPEYLIYMKSQRNIFSWLIDTAKKQKDTESTDEKSPKEISL